MRAEQSNISHFFLGVFYYFILVIACLLPVLYAVTFGHTDMQEYGKTYLDFIRYHQSVIAAPALVFGLLNALFGNKFTFLLQRTSKIFLLISVTAVLGGLPESSDGKDSAQDSDRT